MFEIKLNGVLSKLLINILIVITFVSDVSAQQYCYTSGGVFGIIALTVFTTLFVLCLTFGLIWFLWNKNLLKLDFILKTIKVKKSETNGKRDLESARHPDYAFDNPYFEDEEDEQKSKTDKIQTQNDTIILVEGNEAKNENDFNDINNKYNSERNSDEKCKNGQIINNRFVKSLPLSAVFNNVQILNKRSKPETQKSMDDYFLDEKPQRLEVELIGRDFTGLGFNIYGNMRDGIFIKDVLNRGPANESGKVKAGDRIVSVWVCFESMVFEDAVSILSYASPYNVKIELEKCSQYSTVERLTNSLNINKNFTSNTDKSLIHPLYRSHSVDDLTQIAKDMSLSEKSSSSVGKNVIQKIKTQILNRINIKSLTVDQNVDKSCNFEKERQKPETYHKIDSGLRDVMTEQIETNDSKAEQIDLSDDKDLTEDVVDNSRLNIEEKSDSLKVENQVIRKPVIPAKRKGRAPQPPSDAIPSTVSLESQSISLNVETIETKAQVHNQEIPVLIDEEIDTSKDEKYIDIQELNARPTGSIESITSENIITSEDVSDSVPMRANSPQRVQTPTGKPKSSSMSDLTNNCQKLQSVLLERAVSLDMNGQSLPEENLYHLHTKNTLVLNDETTDSMPIITWSLNKPMKSDTNSSESTLEDTNQIIVEELDLSENLNSIEVKPIDSSNSINENNVQVLDETNFVSKITLEVMPITSTPLKTSQISANDIDSSIHLDLTLSSNENQSAEQTLIEDNKSDSRTDSYENKSQESDETNEMSLKEVIELSEQELDDVMMSHKQFLQKQAKTNGSFATISCKPKTSLIEPQLESLDFESWSYVSEDENTNSNPSPNESTLYKTALDFSLDKDTDNCVKTKKLPEVAGITLKSAENGQKLSNTVFISTNSSLDSSFSSTASSSPSK